MGTLTNIQYLRKLSGVWYNHDRPHERTLAVRINDGKLTVISRETPNDVWSPPVTMFLQGIHVRDDESAPSSIPENLDLARDMKRGK